MNKVSLIFLIWIGSVNLSFAADNEFDPAAPVPADVGTIARLSTALPAAASTIYSGLNSCHGKLEVQAIVLGCEGTGKKLQKMFGVIPAIDIPDAVMTKVTNLIPSSFGKKFDKLEALGHIRAVRMIATAKLKKHGITVTGSWPNVSFTDGEIVEGMIRQRISKTDKPNYSWLEPDYNAHIQMTIKSYNKYVGGEDPVAAAKRILRVAYHIESHLYGADHAGISSALAEVNISPTAADSLSVLEEIGGGVTPTNESIVDDDDLGLGYSTK